MGSIKSGTKRYRQINWAFFFAGFVTFITLYDLQPLLPVFTREFGVSAMFASLPLSVTSCALAVSMLFAGTISETLGRKTVMVASLVTTSVLAYLTAHTQSLEQLVVVRFLQGIALAGLPAVALAYLSEEIAPASLTSAIGLYISGNAIGGMTGRIFTATMAEATSWRTALAVIGAVCFVLSLYFAKSLPPSENFKKRPFAVRYLFSSLYRQLQDPGLLCLYGISFLIMGSFVTLYNYITFRLLGAPYHLPASLVSLIFLVYMLGSFSSSMIGVQVERFGRGRMLFLTIGTMVAGALCTVSRDLGTIVTGIAIFTCGFFGAHTIASSWVGSRAKSARAQAASLYLFFYYLGSSVSGTVGGLFWSAFGWQGVVLLILGLLGGGLALLKFLTTCAETECPARNAVASLDVLRS
ncbi:MFS transporter [Geomonas sp. Red69]|uniref:MFS transporter n=1 Tax=Geomonas diazotrophica TaxID=2843197 RepID=A0ABX8JIV7_9BACT|nr:MULTISPECIES: MFS transporter [Geomonas]MBU5637859.1 MFS transporter [Geomonas diazotrophica]QWV96564.1 MFS transporter [Geomonas nitrogeniifigens]